VQGRKLLAVPDFGGRHAGLAKDIENILKCERLADATGHVFAAPGGSTRSLAAAALPAADSMLAMVRSVVARSLL
jgi:hypothetical protein